MEENRGYSRAGRIGKIKTIKVGLPGPNWGKSGATIVADSEPPADLNYNMWLGPAPKVPYNANRTFYNFRWFYNYSGGQLTNFGVHYVDVIRWFIGIVSRRGFGPFGWYRILVGGAALIWLMLR